MVEDVEVEVDGLALVVLQQLIRSGYTRLAYFRTASVAPIHHSNVSTGVPQEDINYDGKNQPPSQKQVTFKASQTPEESDVTPRAPTL